MRLFLASVLAVALTDAVKIGAMHDSCDWNKEGKDCEEGLTCYKGTCEDRDPPVITLDFGNGVKSAPALGMMPKVELKFPGTKKSVGNLCVYCTVRKISLLERFHAF